MERKYRALRIIGAVYKILGGLAGILTALLVLTICASSLLGGAALSGLERELGGGGGTGFVGGTLGGLVAVLVTILYGGGLAVTLYAIGEGVDLFLAVEENTRTTAVLLRTYFESSEDGGQAEVVSQQSY